MYGQDSQAELAKIPRILQESCWNLGASHPMSKNILGIFWEYWPILLGDPSHACFPYLLKALDSRFLGRFSVYSSFREASIAFNCNRTAFFCISVPWKKHKLPLGSVSIFRA